MKNIRKFETTAEMNNAVLENVSINYNVETNGVLSMPLKPNVKNYMRFVAVEDSQINLSSFNMSTGEADTSVDLKHSKDGLTWTQYDFNPIPLTAGETLYLKGNNENGFTYSNEETGEQRVCTFGDVSEMGVQNMPSTGLIECHGNIMSLLYGDEFEDKTTIPNLGCFTHMFYDFSGLITAPELPATTLTYACYNSMFEGCRSLITAPELPATTLAEVCYQDMFNNCQSLTTAPELPAATLAENCYYGMFARCGSLNHITMLATDISASNCLSNWVRGVSKTGTFVKHPDMTSLPTDTSGIPEGWTVIDYDFKN